MTEPSFCSECGGRLSTATRTRPTCRDCGRVFYLDPKLAAAAIVPLDGGLVLVRRAIEPAVGKWSFPSGYVDRGEMVERAVEREVREETGLEVAAGWLVGLYSQPGRAVVLAVYEATVRGGELIAGAETLEVGTFRRGSLPDLAFEHDSTIFADWVRARQRRGI